MRRNRNRGMSLIEVMIATGLAGVLCSSLLMLVRSQLIAYEASDQLGRTQQSVRAATDFLESLGRRACGGLARGVVSIDTPGVTPVADRACVRTFDGATQSGGSFNAGTPTGTPDAVEIIFGGSPFAALTAAPSLTAATPSVSVADVSGFSVNDIVIVGDMSSGVLLKVSGKTTTGSGGPPTAGTLTFSAPSGSLATPTTVTLNLSSATGLYVMKAYVYSLYVETSSSSSYQNMLMLDANGIIGTDHSKAQPLADGIIDMQVAVGADTSVGSTGLLTDTSSASDSWYGNVSGETLPALPWNGTGNPLMRQIRFTIVAQTLNSYSGTAAPVGQIEDRTTYPTASGIGPRYRSERVVIAPRAWNLVN